MKEKIERLKDITGHTSDASFAKFFGFTKNTITREKRGIKTKLHTMLPMFEYLFFKLSPEDLKEFLRRFHVNNDIS